MPGRKAKKRARRFRPPLPAPRFSSCVYVRLKPSDVAMFRFLLEAEDNLAYASTVDRWASVVRVVFSPHQAEAVREYLAATRELVPFTVIYDPDRLSHSSVHSE